MDSCRNSKSVARHKLQWTDQSATGKYNATTRLMAVKLKQVQTTATKCNTVGTAMQAEHQGTKQLETTKRCKNAQNRIMLNAKIQTRFKLYKLQKDNACTRLKDQAMNKIHANASKH